MIRKRSLAPAILAGLSFVALALVAWLAWSDAGLGDVDASASVDVAERAEAPTRTATQRAPELTPPLDSTPVATIGKSDAERAAVEQAAERELAEAHWVEGVVRWPAGTPLDEELEVVADGRKFASMDDHRVRVGRDGRFRVAFSKDTKSGWLKIEARYCYLETPLRLKPNAPPAEIVLEPALGGCIEGTVLPPAGYPDPQAVLAKSRPTAMSWLPNSPSTACTAKVEDGLRFELRGLAVHRSHVVSFRPAEWVPFEKQDVRVEAGKRLKLDLSCALGARLAGRVVDERGEPLGNVAVTARRLLLDDGTSWEHLRQVNTGQDGAFSLAGVRASKVELRAECDGYLEGVLRLGVLADGEVREGLEFVLDSGRYVAGTVKWNDGQVAGGAWIRVEEAREESSAPMRYVSGDQEAKQQRADGEGRFKITGLGAGPYSVFAHAPEGSRPERDESGALVKKSKLTGPKWRAEALEVRSGADLELVLQPGLTVAGVVVDDNGAAVTKYTLLASEVRNVDVWSGSSDVTQKVESEDGRFVLEGLRQGAWRLTVKAKGFNNSEPVSFQAPHTGPPLTIRVPRTASIAGVVVDASGQPVVKATVEAEVEGQASYRMVGGSDANATTDSKGRFVLRSAPSGSVKLTAKHSGFASNQPLRLSVAPGTELNDVRIVLPRGGRVSGRIHESVLADGRTWFVNMGIQDAHSVWLHASVGPQGTFEFEQLTPGVYSIFASVQVDASETDRPVAVAAAAPRTLQDKVTVEAGATAQVVLGAPSGAAIEVRGRVTHGGRPVAGAEIYAHKEGIALSVKTGADGQFVMSVDGPGRCSFTAILPEGRASQSRQVELPTTKSDALDFEFHDGRIAGRVIDERGQPVSDALVATHRTRGGDPAKPGAASASVQTRSDGRFVLEGLSEGEYRVSASDSRSFTGSARFGAVHLDGVAVGDGARDDELVVRVAPAATIVCVVLMPDGSPAIGATVAAFAAGRGRIQAGATTPRADGAGSATLVGLSGGDYFVSARLVDFVGQSSSSVKVTAGESREVRIELRPGGKLTLITEGADGKRVQARMHVVDSNGYDWAAGGSDWVREGDDGPWTLGPLPAGAYQVSASGKGGAAPSESVMLGAGAHPTIRLRLPAD